MFRPPPISTRTDTLVPCTTLFRSGLCHPKRDRQRIDGGAIGNERRRLCHPERRRQFVRRRPGWRKRAGDRRSVGQQQHQRSEEHTSELQSLMRISYAVFCLKTKNTRHKTRNEATTQTYSTL